jgi:hypothetical protein
VTWIPSQGPLGVRELSARAELSAGVSLVVLHGRLGSIDLREGWKLAVETGDDVVMACGDLTVYARHGGATKRRRRSLELGGWLLEVTSEHIAQDLTERVLLGTREGIEIRGSELAPGIWRARGALAVEGSVLLAPCYLGRGSLVAERAHLGPGGILGEHAIVEEDAEVVHGRVEDHVVVGRGVVVHHACALTGRIVRHAGRQIAIDDPLLLARVGGKARASRLAAALALIALVPVGALVNGSVQRMVRRLQRVANGSGWWVGVRDDQDPDRTVIDVLPLLVPPGAGEEERQAARCIYARNKGAVLDGKLVTAWLLGAARPMSRT